MSPPAAQSSDIKVLILSMYKENVYVKRFKRSGSKGYIFKTASVEEVVTAIRQRVGGEAHARAMNGALNVKCVANRQR